MQDFRSTSNVDSIEEHLAKAFPVLNAINWVAFFGLSVTTLYTADTAAMQKLEQVVPAEWAKFIPFMALGIALAIMYLFDFDLRKNFVLAVQAVMAGDWKNAVPGMKMTAFLVLTVAVIRIALSGGATFMSGAIIADHMVEDGDVERLKEIVDKKEQTKQTISMQTFREAQEIRENAERRAQSLVGNAIDAGGKRWASAWRSGNSWYRTVTGPSYRKLERWRAGIYKAQREADEIRAQAEERIAKLQESRTTLLAQESNDEGFLAVVDLERKTFEKAEEKEWMWTMGLWVADFIFFLLAIATSIALVPAAKAGKRISIFSEETSASQIVYEFYMSVWRMFKSFGVLAVSKIDNVVDNIAGRVSGGSYVMKIQARTLAFQREAPGGGKQAQQKPVAGAPGRSQQLQQRSPTSQQAPTNQAQHPNKSAQHPVATGVPAVGDTVELSVGEEAETTPTTPTKGKSPNKNVGEKAQQSNTPTEPAQQKIVYEVNVVNGKPTLPAPPSMNTKKKSWTLSDVNRVIKTYENRTSDKARKVAEELRQMQVVLEKEEAAMEA